MSHDLPFLCDAMLFDLDGVLVDSTACVERIWHQWAMRHQLDPVRVIALAHGRRTIDTVQLVAPHLDVSIEVAALASSELTTTDGVSEIPGARELLERLPSTAWAIVTSGARAVALLRLRHLRLPVPPVLVCAEDVARGKPDPEGYLAAAKGLGVAPAACVVIEDAPAGLQAARAAGMRAVAICGTYGPEALAIADRIVPDLAGLRITRPATGAAFEIGAAPA